MTRLAGIRAIVTGAGSGIGRAVVRRYIAEGARVVAVVREAREIPELTAEGAIAIAADVRLYEAAERAVATAAEHFGGLDVYVANAGIWDFHKRVEKQSPAALKAAFDEIFGRVFWPAAVARSTPPPNSRCGGW